MLFYVIKANASKIKNINTFKKMIEEYITEGFPFMPQAQPWEIVSHLPQLIEEVITTLGDDYEIREGIAIHRTATLGHDVTIKAPAIIGPHCFVGTHSYLRGGVYLAEGAKIGISCEIKQSIIMHNSAVAHFNFIGDSILGKNVNFEAGSIIANHYNERKDKTIFVTFHNQRIQTNVEKFGALVGDGSRIGANAVLSPGTLLLPNSIVGRLQLIEQNPIAG